MAMKVSTQMRIAKVNAIGDVEKVWQSDKGVVWFEVMSDQVWVRGGRVRVLSTIRTEVS